MEIKFRKTVSGFGKTRRIIEVPKEYCDVIKKGDKVEVRLIKSS